MSAPLLDAVVLFLPVAMILTVTPGTDTLLVLRSASVGGAGAGVRAALGVGLGCAAWAAMAALGLAALIAASDEAYAALKWAGAGYLIWLGAKALLRPRTTIDGSAGGSRRSTSFADGLITNILNPKVGVFYISFLPQFVPPGAHVASTVLALGAIHAALSLLWLSAVAFATHSMSGMLKRPRVIRVLDRATGVLFIAFGLRLVITSSR